ncbi:F-box/kelch-repeat protein [Raphanus sativus]|nr:F-box/kelch-repeat protein [Raphanus sativus]KAJ4873078.1 F-box/kelch-repeat protein [Raphanus sativus]KAJ4880367.1 F-box/kelch-repeat protein [Raphanus sativus]KAJ4880369.1 F-box/kelch-repeat protein [Raphanus sativus]
MKRNYRKKQKNYCPQQDCKLYVLPDDIVMNCLTFVSRLDHGSLYLVSKLHRSLMLSPELYQARSLTGRTERCIYLCLSIPSDPFARWFAFYPKALDHPSRLLPIRPHLYQPPEASSVVAHGWGIYVIGGMIGRKRSSRVFFLDCRSHTWTNLPSMGFARASAAAGVVDGKIYVFGGCEKPNWVVEVFDPKTQTWDALSLNQPPPPDDMNSLMHEIAVIEEKDKTKKIFGLNEKGNGLLYIPSQGIWKTGNSDTNELRKGWHVIDNVIYSCVTGGWILWCETSDLESAAGEMKWRQVMGLDDLRGTLCASKLVNYGLDLPSQHLDGTFPGHKLSNSGPNMLVFWDCPAIGEWEVWCAEISLQRRKETGEIWATVEWSEVVTTIKFPYYRRPCHSKILYSLSFNL